MAGFWSRFWRRSRSWLNDFYFLHVLITTGIFIIAAMSLNLLLGYTGQLSLGHVAFFGIGAYTSALVSLGFDVHVLPDVTVGVAPKSAWFAMLCAVLVAGLTGYGIGKLSFRVRGAYFVIVSISFAEVVRLVAVNWVELTQGPMALNNIPALTFAVGLSSYRSCASRRSIFSCSRSGRLLRHHRAACHSRAGRAMIALRENESLAMSVGIDVTRYLVIATVISAAMAGMAGALYSHYIRIVDPDIFLFIYTVTMVIMVVTGGKGRWPGLLLAAHFRIRAGSFARHGDRARGAVDHVWRADGARRLFPAARHRARDRGLLGWPETGRRRETVPTAPEPLQE